MTHPYSDTMEPGKSLHGLASDPATGIGTEAAIVYRLVLGGCGCWWVENVPPGVVSDPDAPRVCSQHRASHSASVYPSPQGMAMVHVMYVTDAALVDAARELMWR